MQCTLEAQYTAGDRDNNSTIMTKNVRLRTPIPNYMYIYRHKYRSVHIDYYDYKEYYL